MSYNESQWIKMEDIFSWWYTDNVSGFQLAQNLSPYLRNARLDWKSIKIRPWHSLLATLTTGSFPKGISSYLRTLPANDRLIVRHNKSGTEKIALITAAGVVTDITTAALIASDNRMFFQNIGDDIYCMNGSDDFGKLAWTTYTTPSTGITNYAPAFSADFSSSHWAAWFTTEPNKVRKSVGNNYEDFNSAGSDSFDFEEQVTSLSSNDKTLLVFTQNSISTIDLGDFNSTGGVITYKTGKLQTREGTNTNATTVTVWVNTFFFTSNKKISRVVRWNNLLWFEVLELSERKYRGISNIMSSLDDNQDDAFWYYIPKDNLIKWFFKTAGSSINNICIVYDIVKDAFLIDEQKFFVDWVNFKGKNYTISNVEPKVYEDEINQDDEDSWIPFEYNTKEFTLWEPTRKKILWETRVFIKINTLAVLTQEILIDWAVVDTKVIDSNNINLITWWFGTTAVWTIAIWTWWITWNDDDLQEVIILRTKWNLNIIWKKIQFRYTCSTLAAKSQLESLQMRLEIKPELSNNLTI